MSLRELAPGTGRNGTLKPELDIIAVHGLNPLGSANHAFNTWRKPEDDSGNLWLKHDFPKAQPNARIFIYEYNSSPVFGSGQDSFVREANQFLDEIHGARWELGENIPLILVGHSLGGILIKQALVNAWANPKYRGIKEATHSLVFFGTPHSGPSKNLQVGLGMACAKIARSLPFGAHSTLIEVLEQGTLFSDILSETFRHQLETYNILSCYEGIGDIVPFDSAVLNLPGNRETQLRIDADHSNMCRFNLDVQSDVDNYRKVQRNLQMLCADALVGSLKLKQGHDGQNIANGGIDISSILLKPIRYIQDRPRPSVKMYLAQLPDLAWTIYRSCQRTSLPAFLQVAQDVLQLHVELRIFNEKLKSDTYSTDRRPEIEDRLFDCCQTLEGLVTMIEAHGRVSQIGRKHFMQQMPESSGFESCKSQVRCTTAKINGLNQHLASRSMNDLVERLDGLIEFINEGERDDRSLSSRLSRSTISSLKKDGAEWHDLERELVNSGISPQILGEQHHFIAHWLENASLSGRLIFPDEVQDLPLCPDNVSLYTYRTDLQQVNEGSPHCIPPATFVPSVGQVHDSPNTNGSTRTSTKQKNWRYSLVHKLRYGSADPFIALHKAVSRDDYSAVAKLVQEATVSDQIQSKGSILISCAVEKGDSEMLSILVEQTSSVDWCKMLGEQLRLTLHTGSGRDLLDIFIRNGASFGSLELATTMSWASESTPFQMMQLGNNSIEYEGWAQTFLYIAAKLGYIDLFETFVNQYGGINSLVEGTTPFHIACGSGNIDIVQSAFEMGGNFMTLDAQGETPLHAVVWGEVHDNWNIRAALRYLIGKGASLLTKTISGKSLLHLAAEVSNLHAIESLVGIEMHCNILDTFGNTPLHAASHTKELKGPLGHKHRLDPMPFYHPTLRHRVSQFNFRGLSKMSRVILKGYCTEIDGLKFFNRQPKPDERGSHEAVRLLLQYGAAVNAKNNDGVTPLHLASRGGNLPRMAALLSKGADPNIKDNAGWTAIRYAISANSGPAVKLCLEHGADTSESVPVSLGQNIEEELTILEHVKFMRATELLYILRKHENPDCPDETIEGLEILKHSSEYKWLPGRDREREKEERRHRHGE